MQRLTFDDKLPLQQRPFAALLVYICGSERRGQLPRLRTPANKLVHKPPIFFLVFLTLVADQTSTRTQRAAARCTPIVYLLHVNNCMETHAVDHFFAARTALRCRVAAQRTW
eukprot:COSAG06_NODE_31337_length_523_cov_0.851415_1_plen_111_part_10